MNQLITRLVFALLSISLTPFALAQGLPESQIIVSDTWESAPTNTPEASDLAARCMGMPDTELQSMIKDAGSKSTVSRRPSDRAKPFLVVNEKRAVCVKTSSKGFPILPIEAFRETLQFEGMDSDQERALWTSISVQLSLRGTAVALVKNSAGNAQHITYMFVSDTPYRFYYQSSFLKATEFNDLTYQAVFTSPGTMSITSRGKPAENYKFIY